MAGGIKYIGQERFDSKVTITSGGSEITGSIDVDGIIKERLNSLIPKIIFFHIFFRNRKFVFFLVFQKNVFLAFNYVVYLQYNPKAVWVLRGVY